MKNRQKYRLLVVSNMYPSARYPHYGVFVKHSADILSAAGYSVDVIALKKSTNKIKKILDYIIFYLNILFKGMLGKYKVIYAHYASHTALPLLILKNFKNIPIIMNVHGNDVVPETKSDEKFEGIVNKILHQSQLIICPSSYFKDAVIENFNISEEKIAVYPSGGVDTDLFVPMDKSTAALQLDLDERLNYWVYVSRIEEKKGWDLFLKSASKLLSDYPDTRLIVVGDGEQSGQFFSLAEKLGLNDKIIKYNLLSQQEIVKIFNLAELFIFPTYRKSESLGLVGLEAMACETLVILPDKYGPSSYGRDGENSFVFKSGDADSLCQTIKNALSQDTTKIKENARETSLLYNHKNSDSTLINMFDKIFEI